MENEWIKVEDRLPDVSQFVLAYIGAECPVLCNYKGDGQFLALDYVIWDLGNITHWMPLPEPPKQ